MIVASQHPETQRQRSWQGMKERFLLDRIQLQTSDISMWDEELSTAIETDAADPVEPVENDAAVAAGQAAYAAIFEALVEGAFGG